VSTRARVIAVTDRGTTIVMRGHKVAEIARHAGIRPIFSGVSQGWLADCSRLGDLLAFCQSRNIAVTLTNQCVRDEVDRDVRHDGHLELFGGESA